MKSFKLFLCFLVVALAMVLIVAWVVIWGWNKTIAPTISAPQANTPLTAVTSDTIMVATGTGGPYLVGNLGMTLYYFANDTATKSNCTGNCADIWPVFYTNSVVVSTPLQQADFGTIINASHQQTTYKGHPLYYYSKDVHPGDTLGNGVSGVWFLVQP